MGLESSRIVAGPGDLTGSDEGDLIYLSAGDQVARGGLGADAYVFGRNFGNDVIDDVEPAEGAKDPDTVGAGRSVGFLGAGAGAWTHGVMLRLVCRGGNSVPGHGLVSGGTEGDVVTPCRG